MSTASQQLVSTKDKVTTIRELVLTNRDQIQMALPKFLNVDRLVRMFFTSLSTTPKLIDCTPRSLMGFLIQCAQLGLEPGPQLGLIYPVPFYNSRARANEVQVIVGYRGLVSLARRSGEISTIMAHEVYSKDKFEYEYGSKPFVTHKPSGEAERGAITHFYDIVSLKDGAFMFDVMSKGEVDAHRDRYSRAAKDGPWVTNYTEMGKKTPLRRTLKLCPAAIEMQHAITLDERAELQLPQDLGVGMEIKGLAAEEEPAAGGALEALTDSIEAGAQTTLA